MALGGGTFTTMNKVLPGTYINFVSRTGANPALSDRGIAAMALELDWGPDGEVFEVSAADFQKNSMEIFGYAFSHDKLKGLRDLFLNIKTLYTYKLTSGGVKAANDFATAKYSGIRGNDLKIVLQANADNPDLFDVSTILDTTEMDKQTVEAATELKDNAYVTWITAATLAETAGTPLSGGTNGTVTGAAHQEFLNRIESYTYNALGAVTTEAAVKSVYTAFTRRLRDDMGIKFQAVLYDQAADYMGVVNVKNSTLDSAWNAASLVYWVTGIIAGCEVNKSNTNKRYDGEFTVNTEYTQANLEAALLNGEFILHRVNADVRVLEDINSLVTTTETTGEIFKDNQTVRVLDQIGNDIAVLFNTKYLGVVPNNESGRISLWSDIVKHHEELARINAIEDFEESDITVSQGNTKKAVIITDAVTPIGTMTQLYMTVEIS
jgi:hypothetical protein